MYESLILSALLLAATLPVIMLTRDWPYGVARVTLQLALVAVCGVFYVLQWKGTGQTLPMKTWKIQVRTLDGAALNTRTAILRYLAALAGTLAAGAGFLWAFVDRDQQFLHDRLCGTRLFQAQPPGN